MAVWVDESRWVQAGRENAWTMKGFTGETPLKLELGLWTHWLGPRQEILRREMSKWKWPLFLFVLLYLLAAHYLTIRKCQTRISSITTQLPFLYGKWIYVKSFSIRLWCFITSIKIYRNALPCAKCNAILEKIDMPWWRKFLLKQKAKNSVPSLTPAASQIGPESRSSLLEGAPRPGRPPHLAGWGLPTHQWTWMRTQSAPQPGDQRGRAQLGNKIWERQGNQNHCQMIGEVTGIVKLFHGGVNL